MNNLKVNRASAAAVGLLLASIVFIALVFAVKFLADVPAINADRAAVRAKALAEIRAEEAKALTTTTVLDAKRGIVRLPIETAMKITAQQWQNPSAARADLISREEKATAPVKTESFE
ncbi:MAG TPA: hypothetical protein VGI63_05230 [Verrucomicrobiae bacterium]|jgi:hypothetical protein